MKTREATVAAEIAGFIAKYSPAIAALESELATAPKRSVMIKARAARQRSRRPREGGRA